jgi:hypothetical protein
MTALRIRNAGLRRVRVADLEDAPWNHRTHPASQGAALDGAIEELGFFGYPDVYQTPEGGLRKDRLVAKYGADTEIEVNVTDFDEAGARWEGGQIPDDLSGKTASDQRKNFRITNG